MSNNHFHDSVNVPPEHQQSYQQLFFLRNFFQKPDLFRQHSIESEAEVAATLPPLEDSYGEIECYQPGELTSEKLQAIYANDIRPIVIRGFAKEHGCTKKWTPEYFKDNFGDFKLWYSSTEKLVEDQSFTLSEYIEHVLSGDIGRAYLENLSDIFNTHPELHHDIGLNKVGELLDGFASYHKIAQLFIGGAGTGAVFHCANELNCFLNIYGQKEWTFVHPKYSSLMYSSMFNKGIFVGSLVKHKAPVKFLEANQPLYNRIPKLRIVLEPGDMLINPPWWWHAINNKPPVSIAVASRWNIQTPCQQQNPLFNFMQSFREERLTLDGKKLAKTDVVVPDSELRKKYVSYKEMGWTGS